MVLSVRASVVALLAVALAGCAGFVTKDSSPERKEAAIRERAAARWDLLVGKRAAEAYDFLSRASQQVMSRDEFVARMSKTAFRDAVVEKVDCSVDICKVSVRITYDHQMMKGVRNTMVETWLIDGLSAWYVWSP